MIKNKKNVDSYLVSEDFEQPSDNYDLEDGYRLTSYPEFNFRAQKRNFVHAARQDYVIRQILLLGNKDLPDDIKPSKETVKRAAEFCKKVYTDSRMIAFKDPIITAADDNSIDIFWGDYKKRLLVNVPSGDGALLVNLIDERGGTESYFTDGHYFNLINLIKELRDSFD